ncbi:hypothetical protein M6B38_178305 [Iris pallida]|uniref:Uncharacterized protein n=1 Tax=Iris pallida TaxID=29817 RepID=A0AAX6EQ19_IRIPA|nr:hypothetical protein M6B38_178305 [Iris pallida]
MLEWNGLEIIEIITRAWVFPRTVKCRGAGTVWPRRECIFDRRTSVRRLATA